MSPKKTIGKKGVVTGHMIRGTRVKYPSAKSEGQGNKGYKITKLTHDSNKWQGRLLSFLKPEEISILRGRKYSNPQVCPWIVDGYPNQFFARN